jgi:hypothetical protein
MRVAYSADYGPEEIDEMRRYHLLLYGNAGPKSNRSLVKSFIEDAVNSRRLAMGDDLSETELPDDETL